MWVILVFIIMLGLGVPVGFSMVLSGFFYVLSTGAVSLTFIPQAMVSGVSSYTMLAVPFFMLVGDLMNTSGITKRIFNFANCCVGHITGGLGHVNVLGSMIFAGMSGAAVADAAGLGAIEIRAMIDEGFDADFAVGVTAASSILGPIIPPSSPMVLFGVFSGISIGSLFMGGISVGITLGLLMMVLVYIIAKKRNYPRHKLATFGELWKTLISAFPSLLTPIILLGGMFSGYFTPTEAAASAVLYSLILGLFIYKELKLSDVFNALSNCLENLGVVMLLMASGKIFAWVLGIEKITDVACNALFGLTNNAVIIMILLNLLLLFIGTFMETNASIMLLTPLLLPIIERIGMHPVQFGVMFIFALMIGLLTPPMAICLFITSKLGGISFERAFKAVTPYYICMIIVLAIINIFPGFTLTIPRLVFGTAF